MKEREKIEQALIKYLPKGYATMITDKIFENPLLFKITKPRKTKLGDFRPGYNGRKHQITINGNLNKYQFLITSLHEFAHLKTHIEFGSTVKPHGSEWKKIFSQFLEPLRKDENLPDSLRKELQKNERQLKASSCNDTGLYRVLKSFDKSGNDSFLLENLENNQHFYLGNRVFQRGILKRTRYLCKEVQTNKQYLINRLAEVKPLDKSE